MMTVGTVNAVDIKPRRLKLVGADAVDFLKSNVR